MSKKQFALYLAKRDAQNAITGHDPFSHGQFERANLALWRERIARARTVSAVARIVREFSQESRGGHIRKAA